MLNVKNSSSRFSGGFLASSAIVLASGIFIYIIAVVLPLPSEFMRIALGISVILISLVLLELMRRRDQRELIKTWGTVKSLLSDSETALEVRNIAQGIEMVQEGQEKLRSSLTLALNDLDGAALRRAMTVKDSVYHTSSIMGKINILIGDLQVLSAAIEESSAAVNQITQTVAQFSDRVQSQSSAVVQTSASVEQVNASIANIGKITQSKKERSGELLKLTELGESRMAQTSESIRSISQQVETVTEIIRVINKIALQTNLLAMNAAIEAAHAGDAGRGFAVVADEIRSLAESTAKNSKLIANNLKDIVDRVADVETSGELSLGFFRDIRTETSTLVDALDEINMATQELHAGSGEILSAVSSLVGITSERESGAGEMHISAEEINKAIVDIRHMGMRSSSRIQEILESTGGINEMFLALGDSLAFLV